MTPSNTNRGRPKGSGLNDAKQLQAIAGLMTADPDLKPTTAIRWLGIQDPSVIRRLRDKYNALEAELIAERKAGAHPLPPALAVIEPAARLAATIPAEPEASLKAVARAVPLVAIEDAIRSQPVLAALAAKTTAAAPPAFDTDFSPKKAPRKRAFDDIRPPSETDLPNWMGVGLSLFVLGFEAQFAVIGTIFEWAPLAAVVRSQVAFTEIAVAMAKPVVAGVPI